MKIYALGRSGDDVYMRSGAVEVEMTYICAPAQWRWRTSAFEWSSTRPVVCSQPLL